MKSGAGKIKGSSYERTICEQLSLWITDNTSKTQLWRAAMSGGRSTVMGQKGTLNKEQAGDISAVGPLGHKLIDHFYIECKAYKDLNIAKFLLYQNSKLKEFWEEALSNATKVGKVPLLIAKQNYFPELVITTPTLWNHIIFREAPTWFKITHLTFINCQVFLFDDLIKYCKLSEVALITKELEPIV